MASTRPRAIPLRELRQVVARDALHDRGGRFALPVLYDRPQTRADCLPGGCNEERPCPFVSCRHNLYLDVIETTGSLKINFPRIAPEDLDQLEHTCALDLADAGPQTLEDIGEMMSLTRERVRQIEVKVSGRLRGRMAKHYARDEDFD